MNDKFEAFCQFASLVQKVKHYHCLDRIYYNGQVDHFANDEMKDYPRRIEMNL